MLRSHQDALARFLATKSNGQGGREIGTMGILASARERVGKLFGVAAEDIAFLSSASEGINLLAGAVAWKPGDNVVVEDIEFPSGVYAWPRLEQHGVEVRVVRQWGGEASLARLADAVDERTRVIHTSQVSYLTGRRYDLAELASIAGEVGALLGIDATHAAGVIPVEARHADIVVSSCYKFLLAVHGAAIVYRNPERLGDLTPQSIGWHSVRGPFDVLDPARFELVPEAARFEAGNPPFIAVAVLDNALAYLEAIGAGRIQRHVLDLGAQLWDELERRGLPLLTPRDEQRRGPNVAFLWDDPAGLVRHMAERDILIWGDTGRVRISFHVYNGSDDIERFLTAFDEVLAERR
jgi:selenocysteine lyase/cysteine desulfurase